MSSYQSSSNAVILPSISDEAIDHMLNLFSSRMDEIMQEIKMELKASTQSPGISEDTHQKETEQAQAGYEEIRETPAIPDLPRIMPGYQDSMANIDDRENFLCPISDQQSDDCSIISETCHLQENIPDCPVEIVFPVVFRQKLGNLLQFPLLQQMINSSLNSILWLRRRLLI